MIRQFVDSYYAAYGYTPNMFAAAGFSTAKILITAIERTLETTDYAPDSEEFRIALIANMAVTDIVGLTGRITFDEFNNPNAPFAIHEVINGNSVFVRHF